MIKIKTEKQKANTFTSILAGGMYIKDEIPELDKKCNRELEIINESDSIKEKRRKIYEKNILK